MILLALIGAFNAHVSPNYQTRQSLFVVFAVNRTTAKDNQNHHVSADQLAHRPRVYTRVNDGKLRLNSKYDVRTCYQNVSQQTTILLMAPLNQSTKDKSYESDRHSP